MKAMICPQCSASIEVDETKEWGFCLYCGTKIQINETVNINHTGKVQIDNRDVLLEQLIENGNAYLKLSKYEDAIKSFHNAISKFPNKVAGYIGLFIALTENYNLDINVSNLEEIEKVNRDLIAINGNSDNAKNDIAKNDEYLAKLYEKREAVIKEKESFELQRKKNARTARILVFSIVGGAIAGFVIFISVASGLIKRGTVDGVSSDVVVEQLTMKDKILVDAGIAEKTATMIGEVLRTAGFPSICKCKYVSANKLYGYMSYQLELDGKVNGNIICLDLVLRNEQSFRIKYHSIDVYAYDAIKVQYKDLVNAIRNNTEVLINAGMKVEQAEKVLEVFHEAEYYDILSVDFFSYYDDQIGKIYKVVFDDNGGATFMVCIDSNGELEEINFEKSSKQLYADGKTIK